MNLYQNLKNLIKNRFKIKSKSKRNKFTNDEEELDELEKEFNEKRYEYRSTRNIWYSVAVAVTSIGIFLYMFYFILGQSSSQDIVTTIRSNLFSKEFLNNQFASAISLSAAFALVTPVMYTIARLMKTQQRNAEISNLNLEIRNVRSRIIRQRQDKIVPTSEDLKRVIASDIQIMLDLLRDLLQILKTNPNQGLPVVILERIDAIRGRYSEYEERKYKYVKVLGEAFGKVDAAILSFMHLTEPVPSPSPGQPAFQRLTYGEEQVKHTITSLEIASNLLKLLEH